MFALLRSFVGFQTQSLSNIYWARPLVNNSDENYHASGYNITDVGTYDSHDSPITDWRVMEMDEY